MKNRLYDDVCITTYIPDPQNAHLRPLCAHGRKMDFCIRNRRTFVGNAQAVSSIAFNGRIFSCLYKTREGAYVRIIEAKAKNVPIRKTI